MPYDITQAEYLEIDSVPLATPAWLAVDLAPLHKLTLRGSNRLVPHRPGRQPYPRRIDETRLLLKMRVFGDFDPDGAPISDFRAGIEENIGLLNEALILDPTDIYGQRYAEWHRADGDVWAANIIVEDFDPTGTTIGPTAVTAVLTIVVPGGQFVLAGS